MNYYTTFWATKWLSKGAVFLLVSNSQFQMQKGIAKVKLRVLYCASVIFRSKIHLTGYWICFFFPVSILSCKSLLCVAHVALHPYCEVWYDSFPSYSGQVYQLILVCYYVLTLFPPGTLIIRWHLLCFLTAFIGCCGYHYSLQTALGLELNSLALIIIWRFLTRFVIFSVLNTDCDISAC